MDRARDRAKPIGEQRWMMRIVAIAIAIAIAAVLVAPHPAEAARRGAWHTWSSDAKTMTRTFIDRTPGNTAVRVDLEKKPGSKCWARVTLDRRGYRAATFRPLYKHVRDYAVRHDMITDWLGGGGGAARVTAKVQTNGRCVYRLWAR